MRASIHAQARLQLYLSPAETSSVILLCRLQAIVGAPMPRSCLAISLKLWPMRGSPSETVNSGRDCTFLDLMSLRIIPQSSLPQEYYSKEGLQLKSLPLSTASAISVSMPMASRLVSSISSNSTRRVSQHDGQCLNIAKLCHLPRTQLGIGRPRLGTGPLLSNIAVRVALSQAAGSWRV